MSLFANWKHSELEGERKISYKYGDRSAEQLNMIPNTDVDLIAKSARHAISIVAGGPAASSTRHRNRVVVGVDGGTGNAPLPEVAMESVMRRGTS